jgi:hypothetical protein
MDDNKETPRRKINNINKFLQEKAMEAIKQKEEKGGKPKPENKACHSVALLKSVAETGTQSAMKSSRKTLHEFTSHVSPKKAQKEHKYIDERNAAYGVKSYSQDLARWHD